ncbi:MAG: hypothetical protein Q8P82_01965 [bacterium]|nr:hypothetical protein [bacterium]
MDNRKKIQLFGAIFIGALLCALVFYVFFINRASTAETSENLEQPIESVPALDTAAYDRKMLLLAHRDEGETLAPEASLTEPAPLWPAKAAYPNVGALLPFHRIVAYYGNFYSTGMGVLGQYPPDEVLERLAEEMKNWEAADPATPVMPAIDYIAVTAQLSPGKDGKYRARMPDSQIEKAIALAEQVQGIVILEVQPGLSAMLTEVKELEPYLSLPQVHLAIDPEFAMVKSGKRPGTVVGTVDAKEVNEIAEYVASLVKEHDLPPKVLIVHRYTRAMVTNAEKIAPLPEVQIVMDMDGWGPPAQKRNTYQAYIYPYPVQFTGFKLFYRNDLRRPGSRLLTPAEILELTPQPSFIQYQ